jgi:uncharacterized protein with HEPN domain
MNRTWEDYADDILTAMDDVRGFTAGMDFQRFSTDKKTVNAVLRSLEVMGEATKKIPEDVRARHPEIPWKRFAGMRDKLIHEYFGVDLEIVWGVVQEELPPLMPHFADVLRESRQARAPRP